MLLDTEQTREIFKEILLQERFKVKRNLKVKKTSKWIYPSAIERNYFQFIKSIINEFVKITTGLKPNLEEWERELKQIKDSYPNDLEKINEEEYEKTLNEIFVKGKDDLKNKLFNFAILISIFNKRQWNKITKEALNIEFNTFENWENNFIDAWVNNNVGLIKGLSEEYIKKINLAIKQGYDNGLSVKALQKKLKEIDKNMSNARSKLIARDQVSKLNSQFTEQRQRDAGIDTYIWSTSLDERVRATHKVMEGKLCRWDDPTLYSDDNGKTWKSRSSIGGVELHPGRDYQCRCESLANFEPLVEEINTIYENILG